MWIGCLVFINKNLSSKAPKFLNLCIGAFVVTTKQYSMFFKVLEERIAPWFLSIQFAALVDEILNK